MSYFYKILWWQVKVVLKLFFNDINDYFFATWQQLLNKVRQPKILQYIKKPVEIK